jgi:hypothetical protein
MSRKVWRKCQKILSVFRSSLPGYLVGVKCFCRLTRLQLIHGLFYRRPIGNSVIVQPHPGQPELLPQGAEITRTADAMHVLQEVRQVLGGVTQGTNTRQYLQGWLGVVVVTRGQAQPVLDLLQSVLD